MHLESIFYLSDWQQLSGGDRDLGTGDPVLDGVTAIRVSAVSRPGRG
jgi:hypothetical protein